jgi:hypothetical protein
MTDSVHPSLTTAWQMCEATRHDVLSLLAGMSPDAWQARPQSGQWTVAQQVDHLIRSEVGTSKMARRLIRGDYRDVPRPAEARYFDSQLDRYPYGQLAAPAPLVPVALPMTEARTQLTAAHERFAEELLRFAGPDADALAAPDPDTGWWFTLAGWVRLQALHEAHHLAQIRAGLGD